MSSTIYVAPLRLELTPSRLLRYYLIFLHTSVLLSCLLPSRLPWIINALCIAGVSISAYYSYCTLQREQAARSNMRWIWQATDRWYDLVSASEWQMQPNYFLTPWLIILTLRNVDRQQRRLVIWQDQLSVDCYRDLYRRLKYWHTQDDQIVAGE